jgi:hypothetical protein
MFTYLDFLINKKNSVLFIYILDNLNYCLQFNVDLIDLRVDFNNQIFLKICRIEHVWKIDGNYL